MALLQAMHRQNELLEKIVSHGENADFALAANDDLMMGGTAVLFPPDDDDDSGGSGAIRGDRDGPVDGPHASSEPDDSGRTATPHQVYVIAEQH